MVDLQSQHSDDKVETDGPTLDERYRTIRDVSTSLTRTLSPEDCCIQSMPDVSPTKWHLAHTSWFFETFVLKSATPGYRSPHPQYEYLFNSYYNTVGEQYSRPARGLLSRPTLAEVLEYRSYVDDAMNDVFAADPGTDLSAVIEIGLHHEQQHQELLLMDIKHVFWCNPLRPAYRELPAPEVTATRPMGWLEYGDTLEWIGHDGAGFAFDNESPRHKEYVPLFQLADRLITCGEYLEFIEDRGYERPELWLSEGWNVVQTNQWRSPLYWENRDGCWRIMTLAGMRDLNPAEPVCHVSYFEADAYARWRDCWLPREAAWESVATSSAIKGNFRESDHLHPVALDSAARSDGPDQMFGDVWEWTSSPYSAYPGFRPATGAIGEYNGKFMCNQIVLRGGSCVTPRSHIRASYRNFFGPGARWPFTGIRLAKEIA